MRATTLNSRARPFERLIPPRQDIAPISANYRALLLFIINLNRGSFCALLLIVANPIFAQTEQTVDRFIGKDVAQINLALAANFLEDPTGALTLAEVVALKAQGAFTQNSREQIHFGMTRSAYWIHLTLPWRGDKTEATGILEIGPPKLVPGRVRGGVDLYTLGAEHIDRAIRKYDSESPIW